MVANPIRRGSRRPTRQLLISTAFFCLGFISVGFTSSRRSFKAPSNTAGINVHIVQSSTNSSKIIRNGSISIALRMVEKEA
jgi:hypothetical membrane protein